jgi:prepilin-type N-terminal cleavage/methylation domain-containing protein
MLKSAKNKRHHQKGFSLVETLVALLVLSGGLVAIMQAFSQSATAWRIGQERMHAQQMLREIIVLAQTSDPIDVETEGHTRNGWSWTYRVEPVAEKLDEIQVVVEAPNSNLYKVQLMRFSSELDLSNER